MKVWIRENPHWYDSYKGINESLELLLQCISERTVHLLSTSWNKNFMAG